MFFEGFFISPAMKVTLFQASLLNKDPFMEIAMAPSNAIPLIALVTVSPFIVLNEVAAQAFSQLADQISCFAPKEYQPKQGEDFC